MKGTHPFIFAKRRVPFKGICEAPFAKCRVRWRPLSASLAASPTRRHRARPLSIRGSSRCSPACRLRSPRQAAEPSPREQAVASAVPASSSRARRSLERLAGGLQRPWSLAFTPEGEILVTEKYRGTARRAERRAPAGAARGRTDGRVRGGGQRPPRHRARPGLRAQSHAVPVVRGRRREGQSHGHLARALRRAAGSWTAA